ncbi:60S ribosomal protein L9-B [Talaromyces islandicus]|uniref:60S ribosomal protein L9-B n=1 Tax=Talaromyces islandicus TaxID=28573 RepID=A0A0U1LRA9_TALIS|nr:60S ribosomal protein L9-B [Talaromyces islandicus]
MIVTRYSCTPLLFRRGSLVVTTPILVTRNSVLFCYAKSSITHVRANQFYSEDLYNKKSPYLFLVSSQHHQNRPAKYEACFHQVEGTAPAEILPDSHRCGSAHFHVFHGKSLKLNTSFDANYSNSTRELQTDAAGGVQKRPFYQSTVKAMDNARAAAIKKNNDAKDRSHIQKLDDIEKAATGKQSTLREKQETANRGKSEDVEEISVAGRTKMQVPKLKNEGEQVPIVKQAPAAEAAETEEDPSQEKEAQEASAELDSILKRSPIIIFSKTYCPYSKKAKAVLLDRYSIVPAPHVVELDIHPQGYYIQQLLGDITGRRTVPNILVNGLSIGGGDDIVALDQQDELASKIKSMAGQRVMEVKRVPETTNSEMSISIRARIITVEGPRGKLTKDLSHIAVTFGRPTKNSISIELHHGVRKGVATLRTVRTLINNLIIGVTRGFLYKMRYVYAHFPINVNIEKNAETGLQEVEIRNFLGEKIVRRITAQPGVEIITSPNVKDELQLSGNSLENVSQSAADIQQICRVRNKDIRKFLDGLYVSERTNIVVD